jgi:hypothetical protein
VLLCSTYQLPTRSSRMRDALDNSTEKCPHTHKWAGAPDAEQKSNICFLASYCSRVQSD